MWDAATITAVTAAAIALIGAVAAAIVAIIGAGQASSAVSMVTTHVTNTAAHTPPSSTPPSSTGLPRPGDGQPFG